MSSKRLTNFQEPDREVAVALMLSTKREVFKPALLMNAAALILANNHPSGDTTPSLEDRTVSLRIAEAGKVLGVELLDHLTIGRKSVVYLTPGCGVL